MYKCYFLFIFFFENRPFSCRPPSPIYRPDSRSHTGLSRYIFTCTYKQHKLYKLTSSDALKWGLYFFENPLSAVVWPYNVSTEVSITLSRYIFVCHVKYKFYQLNSNYSTHSHNWTRYPNRTKYAPVTERRFWGGKFFHWKGEKADSGKIWAPECP